MFVDKVTIEVRSGKGGDGAIAFLHEKYVAKGGPAGGNGGRGGSIILKSTKETTTLFNYRHSKVIQAFDGGKGGIKNMYGRDAEDVTVEVPIGTAIYDVDGNFITDLDEVGKTYTIAKGGRGGRGNACFANSINRAPKIAENGLPGETKRIILELKLLADVGLVGLPSVGKSTLLSIVSNAKPEIADYPFTTLMPNLGVVSKYNKSFVMADLPGLIEGAAQGKGLGIAFLRHIERCRVLVQMISMDGKDDPFVAYQTIRKELKLYGCNLLKRPFVLVATKMDEDGAVERYKAFKKRVRKPVIAMSAYTHEGVDEIIDKCFELLATTPAFPLYGEDEKQAVKIYDAKKNEKEIFKIVKVNNNTWRIQGDSVERTYSLINISTDEGLIRLINYLRRVGVDDALAKAGAKDGDTVLLKDFEFEYIS